MTLTREQAENMLMGLSQDKVSGNHVAQLLAYVAASEARVLSAQQAIRDREREHLEACSEIDTLQARVTQLEEALKRLYQVYIGQDDMVRIGEFIQNTLTPAAAQEEK